ncbi:MAG: hypothetical protein Salg2KO_05520 [Salibacteraceae bacterium]
MFLKHVLILTAIASFTICGTSYGQWHTRDVRIDPVFFPLQYWNIHFKVKRQMRSTGEKSIAKHLAYCPITTTPHNEEICLHNRFILLDFILYYNMVRRYLPKAQDKDSFALELARSRDNLYSEWMSSLSSYQRNGYFEWEDMALDTLSLDEYLNLGTQRFRKLQRISGILNRKPPLRKPAKRMAHETLMARTPFSSIQPHAGFGLATDASISQLQTSLKALRTDSFEYQNTFTLLSSTLGSQEMALILLGSLAAQRMYMVRDYRSWLLEQPNRSESDEILKAFQFSSELYFTLESAGRDYGAHVLFPTTISSSAKSYKAYHFWTTALLSYQLAKAGFNQEDCLKESVRPARKYKRFIQIPGVMHNIILLRPLRSGTTSDLHRVLHEQRLGAQWGYQFYTKTKKVKQPNLEE